jgi:hypothetical protein
MSNLCPYCGECACCAHPSWPCPNSLVAVSELASSLRATERASMSSPAEPSRPDARVDALEIMRQLCGFRQKDGKHCIDCGAEFSALNVFTRDGAREASISGLCESCFDAMPEDA